VLVCHTPGVLNNAVANLALSMILALARNLVANESHVRSGNWSRGKKGPPLGIDIEGKTVGIVGFGRIGQEVTRRVQALGMRAVWHDVFDKLPDDAPQSEYRTLDGLLAESDFVSLHTNLSDSTHHMIGAEELNRMKSSAFLINTARGPLVDQAALTEALRSGVVKGAALDVFESEPPDAAESILRLPNALCVPHIASATVETRRAMLDLAVRNLLDGVAGRRPPAPVNPEVLG